MSRCTWFLVSAILGACLASAAAVEDIPLFGTRDGYDAGGPNAMCWEYQFPSKKNWTHNKLEFTTDSMYATRNGSLLPSCYNGTTLTFLSPDLANQTMYKEKNYTFRLNLHTNISAMDKNISVSKLNGTSVIFARLQFCNALMLGFCNPMKNTIHFDENITRAETDLWATDSAARFTDDASWNYQENRTLLGIQEGALIFSRWIRWTLKESTINSDVYNTSLDIRFYLPEEIKTGSYFIISHVVMSFDVGNQTERIDVAQALQDDIVEVRNQPDILSIGYPMKVFLGIVIGCTGSVALAMLAFIVYHREHPVMRLAQSSFLAVMSAAIVVQICFTFTVLPTKDVYCNLSGLLVAVPLTLVAAILVGRVWRVNRILSNVNLFARDQRLKQSRRLHLGDWFVGMLTFLAMLPKKCRSRLHGAPSSSLGSDNHNRLRQTATAGETASLVFFLTLPQIVVQAYAAAHYHRELELQLNSAEDVGRLVCDEQGKWAYGAGVGIAAILYLIAVILAWISRSLPSAFNEKQQIFQAATLNTMLAFIALSLTEITDEPTTPPALAVFLRSLVSIGVALSVMILILLPKVRRVLSGEKVVVSTLLDSRYTPPSSASTDEGRVETTQVSRVQGLHVRKKHVLHSDDPLPSNMERQIIVLLQVLGSIAEKSGDGRPLEREEFARLLKEVSSLKSYIDNVEYAPPDESGSDPRNEWGVAKTTEPAGTETNEVEGLRSARIEENDEEAQGYASIPAKDREDSNKH